MGYTSNVGCSKTDCQALCPNWLLSWNSEGRELERDIIIIFFSSWYKGNYLFERDLKFILNIIKVKYKYDNLCIHTEIMHDYKRKKVPGSKGTQEQIIKEIGFGKEWRHPILDAFGCTRLFLIIKYGQEIL